jgi:hypothetical protein
MLCITLLVPRVAAQQVVEADRHAIIKPTSTFAMAPVRSQPVAMKWQVVTDEKGRRQLEMRWGTQK